MDHDLTSPLCIWDYNVSKKTGFLLEDPLEYLPTYFDAWNQLAKSVCTLLERCELRNAVNKTPLLDHTRLSGYRQKRLAHLQLTVITSGYVWQESEDGVAHRLPKCIAVPLWSVSAELGLKTSVSPPSLALANWTLDESGNLDCMYSFPGGEAGRWFFAVLMMVELAFTKGLPQVQAIMEGEFADDSEQTTSALLILAEVIDDMRRTMNRTHEKLSADVFFNIVRRYLQGWGCNDDMPDGLIFEGISEEPVKTHGGSAAQTCCIQIVDALLGVSHKPDKQSFLNEMRNYMLPIHKQLIIDLENRPQKLLRMVSDSKNMALKAAYNKCLTALTDFRSSHFQIAVKYIVVPSHKHGRKKADAQTRVHRGAGGTDLIPFLKELRNDSKPQFS